MFTNDDYILYLIEDVEAIHRSTEEKVDYLYSFPVNDMTSADVPRYAGLIRGRLHTFAAKDLYSRRKVHRQT